MSRRALALTSCCTVLALLAAPAAAEEAQVLQDRWDATSINGTRAGWTHTVARRLPGPDGPRIEVAVETRTEMARMNAKILVEEKLVTVEREDGSLVSLRSASKTSGTETLVEVSFEGGSATIATTTLGKRREAKVPVPEGTVGPWRAQRIPVEAGLVAGTSHPIRQFMPDFGGPTLVTAKVVGPEEVEGADGAKQRLVRVDAAFEVMPLVVASWLSADGVPVRTRTEIMGMKIETVRTTEEDALRGGDGKPAEVFVSSLLATRHLVPHPRLADTALLHVRRKSGPVVAASLVDDRHVVERTEADGSVLLRVGRVVPPPGASGRRPLSSPPAELAPFLTATSMLQADDPLIRSSMEEAVAGETNAWRAAQAIERWVYHAISKKSLDVAFASALEVCRDRKGDCTEHALLTAALCRAAGIPSRVVMGLEYVTGIFGGHAWTEVWIEGRWYGLDATLGTGSCDALHLTLGRMALAEGTYGAEFASLLAASTELEVDVREVTCAGRTIQFDADAVRTDEGRYLNLPWGLAVRPVEGFAVEARGAAEGLSQRLAEWKGRAADGTDRRIRARAESLAVDQDLAAAAKIYARGAALEPATVDGRPALVGDVGSGDRRARVAFVVDDVDSLFAFALDPAPADADRALFDAFLAGVDLDATPAGR